MAWRADPRRAALDSEILAWMREGWPSSTSDDEGEARFDRLARELFQYQFEHCAPYARFCEARSVTPGAVTCWRDIPAVPAGAFKELALHSFPVERRVKTFRTSGTSTTRPGSLHLDTLELYEASLLPTLRGFLFPDLEPHEKVLLRVLAPSPAESPTSSLSHMFGCLVDALGSDASGYDIQRDKLASETLSAVLQEAEQRGEPVALCGTAFAFVHLLERLATEGTAFELPKGSRIMETGGFKGRAREMRPEELYAELEARLGVPASRIVNQYGMTELGSQFYDSVLVEPDAPRRKLGPPWARARVIDPETARDARPGEVGFLVVLDLANTGSVAAIATADLARSIEVDSGTGTGSGTGEESGFELLGRAPGAEARGCSIAADLMLA